MTVDVHLLLRNRLLCPSNVACSQELHQWLCGEADSNSDLRVLTRIDQVVFLLGSVTSPGTAFILA